MNKRFSKIYVEITNICNLNCSFCSKDNRKKKEMSLDEFSTVLDKIKDYTDNIYLHVKGEPLLHSKLEDILVLCDKKKIRVSITTNGTMLSKMQDILIKHPLKQINVSLHSENNMDNYFYDVFKICDELKEQITIIYRIWTLNNFKLDKISTKIVDKIINHYHLSSEIVNKIINDKNIKITDNIYLDKDCEFDWPNINAKKETLGTCYGTRSHIAILSDGTVVPCCLDSQGILKLGNIFENNMEDILNNELFCLINKGFKNYRVMAPLCQSCTYRKRFDKNLSIKEK